MIQISLLALTFDWPDVLTKVLTVSHTPHSETTLNTTNGWRTAALKNQSGTEQGCQKERGRSANDIVGHENTGQRWTGNLKHFLTFVVVNIQVVWCWEDGDEGGESSGLTFAVHPVASDEKERACCCHVLMRVCHRLRENMRTCVLYGKHTLHLVLRVLGWLIIGYCSVGTRTRLGNWKEKWQKKKHQMWGQRNQTHNFITVSHNKKIKTGTGLGTPCRLPISHPASSQPGSEQRFITH